jgi:hypothetical protein
MVFLCAGLLRPPEPCEQIGSNISNATPWTPGGRPAAEAWRSVLRSAMMPAEPLRDANGKIIPHDHDEILDGDYVLRHIVPPHGAAVSVTTNSSTCEPQVRPQQGSARMRPFWAGSLPGRCFSTSGLHSMTRPGFGRNPLKAARLTRILPCRGFAFRWSAQVRLYL